MDGNIHIVDISNCPDNPPIYCHTFNHGKSVYDMEWCASNPYLLATASSDTVYPIVILIYRQCKYGMFQNKNHQ